MHCIQNCFHIVHCIQSCSKTKILPFFFWLTFIFGQEATFYFPHCTLWVWVFVCLSVCSLHSWECYSGTVECYSCTLCVTPAQEDRLCLISQAVESSLASAVRRTWPWSSDELMIRTDNYHLQTKLHLNTTVSCWKIVRSPPVTSRHDSCILRACTGWGTWGYSGGLVGWVLSTWPEMLGRMWGRKWLARLTCYRVWQWQVSRDAWQVRELGPVESPRQK